MRLCACWGRIFEARVEGERHHCHETILQHVQTALDDIQWQIDRHELHEMMATKEESAPCPDGIPKSICRCGGVLGSQFLFNAYKHVLEGGAIPAQFAASRTVFIPNSSDVDNNGLIVRLPNAPRPLTLCNCDCKILTTVICRGLHWYTMRYGDLPRPSLVHHEMYAYQASTYPGFSTASARRAARVHVSFLAVNLCP